MIAVMYLGKACKLCQTGLTCFLSGFGISQLFRNALLLQALRFRWNTSNTAKSLKLGHESGSHAQAKR